MSKLLSKDREHNSPIATTPPPPYYAVIFTSQRTDVEDGYAAVSNRMVELATRQPGFLGVESARENLGITVSYWESIEAIKNWKQHSEHLLAQKRGQDIWYSAYKTRICKVEHEYGFERLTPTGKE